MSGWGRKVGWEGGVKGTVLARERADAHVTGLR